VHPDQAKARKAIPVRTKSHRPEKRRARIAASPRVFGCGGLQPDGPVYRCAPSVDVTSSPAAGSYGQVRGCAARLVMVDLVIDLGDRESMNSKVQRFARAARRWRMCARYSSNVSVSATPLDFGTATLDFGVPRLRGAVVRFAVETTDQLVRKARTFLRREAKNVSRAHSKYSTDFRPVFPPAQHACVLGSVGQLWRSKSSGRLGLAYLSRYERAPTIAIHVSGPI
jgi:hypothetical protein